MDPSSRNFEYEAAAFADLDDLDAWRVFADWLLSQGDPRGELASLTLHLGDAFLSERSAIVTRIKELERPFHVAWREWKQEHGLHDVRVTLQRGFAYTLAGSLTQLQPVLDELFEHNPIQRLILTGVEPLAIARLFDRRPPWLARLRYLKLKGKVDETALAALAANELPALQRLNLLGTGIAASACKQLARLQTRTLEHLTLTANAIDQAALIQLLSSPTRSQWRALYLSSNPIDASGIALLAADDQLALTALYLAQIEAGLADFAPLTDPAAIPTLQRLELCAEGYWRSQQQAVLDQLRERFGSRLRAH